MKKQHSIKAVATRTGLSPHVIRVWERRYGAVTPSRTDTNRRVYSDEDIDRLILLRKATLAGESIGQIASLPTDELLELVGDRLDVRTDNGESVSGGTQAEFYLKMSLDAVMRIDAGALEATLLKAYVALGQSVVLNRVVRPLLDRIGDMWSDGSLKVMHEHLVSAVVRTFLGHMVSSGRADQSAPTVVSTTPTGQAHEFGALMAAVVAAYRGWRAVYLGPNSPAEDIARAVSQSKARVAALSIVYPPDDPQVNRELTKLRQLIGPDVAIVAGGRSVASYMKVLDEIHARIVEDFDELSQQLDIFRSSGVRLTR